MAARELLQNPALFQQDYNEAPWDIYREWIGLCEEHPDSLPFRYVHRQAYWILERHIGKKERGILIKIDNIEDLRTFEQKLSCD